MCLTCVWEGSTQDQLFSEFQFPIRCCAPPVLHTMTGGGSLLLPLRSAACLLVCSAGRQSRSGAAARRVFAIQHRLSAPTTASPCLARQFSLARPRQEIVQFNLSDIGEGIKEVTVKVRLLKHRKQNKTMVLPTLH